MISDEAVEAAVDALVMTRMGDYNIEMPEFRRAARAVLEAAAPHMLAEAKNAAFIEGLLANPYRG